MGKEWINISDIKKLIDRACDDGSLKVDGVDDGVMDLILKSDEFDCYVQNQANRQIIRTYLVNARVHGWISDDRFSEFLEKAETSEGRDTLATSIIFSAVPFAQTLFLLKKMQSENLDKMLSKHSLAT